ncbi:MAG: chromosomal replication initiator protein DnaA [Phycisphaeraceae bacterium]|nr:chromosomal replication initiator protein DnaA [Phycisphaeraceae bacterium]MBX3367623.1 chromosomal replication initiator protein DnaA [Phycisphaeraceae bacterium]
MADPDRKIWEGMLSHLRAHNPAICRQWFEELEPLGVSGGVMAVRTLTAVHRDYLRSQCLDHFNDAIRSVSGQLLAVRFLGPDEAVAPPARNPRAAGSILEPKPQHHHEPAITSTSDGSPSTLAGNGQSGAVGGVSFGSREASPRQHESLVINPDYTFDNFVIGPGNRLAHAAAVAVADMPGRAYNPIFVHGGVGLGKSHLLQAICLRIAEERPAAAMYYTSCEGFMTQFIEAVQQGQMNDFRHRFRDVDVLVVDDIHFLAKRDRTQEEFFHTFNALYQAHKQIILSSDAPPEEIPDLEERLVSRFKWGLVTKVEPPDYETRVEIVKAKARIRGFEIPNEVAGYIAERIKANIRELEGAVIKLQIQAKVESRPIDLSLASAALGDIVAAAIPSIQAIVTTVTTFYGVRLADLQSKRRQQSVVLPRQICMYLARKLTRHSLEEIGGFFGGRDHTTVMHALKAIVTRREQDDKLDAAIRSMEERLTNGHY